MLNNIYLNFRDNYYLKEASQTEASFIVDKKDSIFKNKYENIKKKYNEGDYVESLSQILALDDQLKKDKNINQYFLINLLIGNIYSKTGNHNRALSYYKKILQNLKEEKLLDNDVKLSFNKYKAETFLKIGSSFYRLSIKDSAKIYYNKINQLPNLNNEILDFKALSYINLSGLYQQDSLFETAIIYADKAIKVHEKLNLKVEQASGLNNLGSIYLSLNNFEEAKKIYNRGIDLIKNDKSEKAVRYKAKLYYNLAWAMRNLKDYKAYDYQELSYEIKDGIKDKEIRRMIEEVTAKYNVAGIKRVEENKRLKDQRTFWIFGIGSFIVMISLVYFLNLYKLKQKNLRLKLSQTQLLQNQNIEKLKSESQARILNATIDGKETERKEIAETLHDSVSALLSSANLHLMAAKPLFKGDIPIEIGKTQSIIAEASQKIRDLSHTLVSSVLLKFGLNFAIKDIATKYSNSVLQIDTDISSLRRYHQDFEIKIYNIIQEFVNNILKHSKASYTLITLYEKDKNLCFQITDDGVGFDKNKAINKDGLGLNQIEARIRMMNGKFLIESTIGEGTTISVELPIIEKS
ncbi:tetratricopeptide repeat protein [uncultured Polaribacter sp.]|uniref:tetratricopeptide repeat protein n=1 Tax=uncultured Polaribacter sp. TaxID=174711 RepID=UPI002622EA8A|nr:tetratricopeptide repeat protein [uncultured Polaribacter sp.]